MSTYHKVPASDGGDGELAESRDYDSRRKRHYNSGPCRWTVWLVLLVTTNAVSLLWASNWSWSELDHLKVLTVWSPMLSSLPYHLHTEKLDVMTHTDSPSPWRQPPSPESDKLWKDNWNSHPMLMPVDDIVELGHDMDYVVRWPRKGADGRETTLVGNHAHHLLHCLGELRRSVWADHYWPEGNLNPFYRNHQMHCVDMLRQDLMCRAPRDVYPMIWVETETQPQPLFNVSMKCAKNGWNDMWSWWSERQLTDKQVDEGLMKPPGVKEWPAPESLKKENAELKELCSKPDVHCEQAGESIA